MTRPSLPRADQRRVPLGLILLLALPAFGLACSGDTAPLTGPEFAKGGIPPVVVNTLADNGNGTCTAQTCTLRDAISTAPAGATVSFANNLCGPGARCTITLTGGILLIEKALRIIGPTRYTLAIDGNHEFEVLVILDPVTFRAVFRAVGRNRAKVLVLAERTKQLSARGGLPAPVVTVKNLTISGGNQPEFSGGGIFNGGSLALENGVVSGNTALGGGGISNVGGTLTLTKSTVSGNTANGNTGEGGGIANDGTLTLEKSTVSGNTAVMAGGGISNGGTLTLLKQSCVSGNTAPTDPDIAGTFQGTNCP